MGKKQHQSDKLYLTSKEWSLFYGGHKEKRSGPSQKFRRLPYDCCSLSMQPFEHPYCTAEGVIFDLVSIVPFLKKYGISPVSGKKMSAKELIKLEFHKNSEGKYHCPVTFKVLTENTHIMAVKPTGNVFSMEAVERLNIKPGFWKDLLTDEPFTRADLITIQDPGNLAKFNLSTFHHVKQGLKVETEEEELAKKDPRYRLKAVSAETTEVLDTLAREYKPAERTEDSHQVADKTNAAHYSTGKVSSSFTSTAMGINTEHERAVVDEDEVRYARLKKKGYVRVTTSHGDLNLELHSDAVTKTCENFVRHCREGYYDGTVFHRSIRNFMIQGGDPTGTGTGGDSVWGGTFKDEFRSNLSHAGRGILSMANSGKNTNKSQFYITYRSCKHLDNKHTVFGRVVGGLGTLDKMEAVKCDKKDKPKVEIKIVKCQVFVDPYQEVDDELREERAREVEEAAVAKTTGGVSVKPKPAGPPKVHRKGVGKYIDMPSLKRAAGDTGASSGELEAKKKKKKKSGASGFSDFSSW